MAIDNALGLIPPAKAYYNVRSAKLGISDVINLVENTEKNIVEGGRKAYNLFFNGTEIIDTANNIPIFFNDDGNVYNDSKDNVNQNPGRPDENPSQPPPPEVKPIEGEQTEREKQLLDYRRNLYYTPRLNQSNIVDFLNDEISEALIEDKLITLDVLNIPSAIAYRQSFYLREPISTIDKTQSGLVASPNDKPADPARMVYLLYINGTLQLNEFENDLLFNEYGDKYNVKDFRGEPVNLTYPFRPGSRSDLSVPEPEPEVPFRPGSRSDLSVPEPEPEVPFAPTNEFVPQKKRPIINPISTIVGSTRTMTGLTQEVTRESEKGFFGNVLNFIEALYEDGIEKDNLLKANSIQRIDP